MFGDSQDRSGNEDVLNGSPGGDTPDPAFAAWLGDNDVGPGHLDTAERDACQDGDERADQRVADDIGIEEADDAAVEKVVDY